MITLKDLDGKPFSVSSDTQLDICIGTLLIPNEICPDGISWFDGSPDLSELIADEHDIAHVSCFTINPRGCRKHPVNIARIAFKRQDLPDWVYIGLAFYKVKPYTLPAHQCSEDNWREHCISLFTCAVIRNVHLELATDLTAKSFFNAFRRFVARRSCPKLIYSDNATSFKLGSELIHQMLEGEEFQEELTQRGCEWIFIPPRALRFGGFYERLIGSVKGKSYLKAL